MRVSIVQSGGRVVAVDARECAVSQSCLPAWLHLDECWVADEPGRVHQCARVTRAVRNRRRSFTGGGRRVLAQRRLRARVERLGFDVRWATVAAKIRTTNE